MLDMVLSGAHLFFYLVHSLIFCCAAKVNSSRKQGQRKGWVDLINIFVRNRLLVRLA